MLQWTRQAIQEEGVNPVNTGQEPEEVHKEHDVWADPWVDTLWAHMEEEDEHHQKLRNI